MRSEERRLLVMIVAVSIFVTAMLTVLIVNAKARDLGQWSDVDPEKSAWYKSLKQADSGVSCCGEADAYFCDEHARKGQVYCIIADDRDNEVLHRNPIPNGTEIDIPENKLNRDPNLEGRAIVFLSTGRYVWCFISASGS